MLSREEKKPVKTGRSLEIQYYISQSAATDWEMDFKNFYILVTGGNSFFILLFQFLKKGIPININNKPIPASLGF